MKTLSLNNNNINKLPNDFGLLKNLTLAILSNNQLTILPSNISELINLKTLILTGNNISENEKTRIKKALPNCKIYF